MRFLIDEDMPRSLTDALIAAGHEAIDVREEGHRGATDHQVFELAQRCRACLVTEDLGFANILRFPLGSHQGIIVGRFPSILSTRTVVAEIVHVVQQIGEDRLRGALVIAEIGQWRIRSG